LQSYRKNLKQSTHTHTYLIEVKGLVQGVGFRPFIYRLAMENNLKGWVKNTNRNVLICITTTEAALKKFIKEIQSESPPASDIISIDHTEAEPEIFSDFRIIASSDISDEITEVSPDIAVCADCLRDMKVQEHRISYPFLNCTNCGPRFTIIRDLPYDRANTTMSGFMMCETCRSEYDDAGDRRFHAQPVACNNCGPEYELIIQDNHIRGINKILKQTADLINTGKILAIKGQGGFHLACDALNEAAVDRLRKLKYREGKPFAVMFRDVESIKEYARLNSVEEQEVTSWRRPIVTLKAKRSLAYQVSSGLKTIGCMLPYMPFHYQLFELLKTTVIVLTSGNLSDEPILTDNNMALKVLGPVTDAVVHYNREIYNRTDDSVVMVVNETPRMLRRSRGYVPNPVRVKFNAEGILATGAELVNCFCLGKGNYAILSQHIGDLKNFETYTFYTESIDHFSKIFRMKAELIAHDMHPDYLSTRYAIGAGLDRTAIQHHHAHIASAMAENGLDEKVIGVSFDGTGYGDDGNVWGGEFLICDLNDYTRYTHFDYRPMPGGDMVTQEPWRMAVSYLYSVYGEGFLDFRLPFLKSAGKEKLRIVVQMLGEKLNTPLTSGAGRLFDAVAALLNICVHSEFHAEAPMRLENAITPGIEDSYPFFADKTIVFNETFRYLLDDLRRGISAGIISAKFHNTVIEVVGRVAEKIRQETGLKKVVMSGGTFQNRYLLQNLEPRLKKSGFDVCTQNLIPSNDGGIALGQLAIAAKRRELRTEN
jgi:hydrogenase maturation protein HypF